MLVPQDMMASQSKLLYQINKYYGERVQTRKGHIAKTIREVRHHQQSLPSSPSLPKTHATHITDTLQSARYSLAGIRILFQTGKFPNSPNSHIAVATLQEPPKNPHGMTNQPAGLPARKQAGQAGPSKALSKARRVRETVAPGGTSTATPSFTGVGVPACRTSSTPTTTTCNAFPAPRHCQTALPLFSTSHKIIVRGEEIKKLTVKTVPVNPRNRFYRAPPAVSPSIPHR